MKRLTRYFLEGLLYLVPVVATVYVIFLIVSKIDGIFDFDIPGMGLLTTFVLITLIGFMFSNFLSRKLLTIVDNLLSRLPLVKMIYNSIKDLIDAFVGDKKSFNKPVSVEFMPGSNVRGIGFVTSNDLEHLGLKGSVAVYLPQSYNFAGNLIIVPAAQVTPLKADSGEVMAFVVSGGVTSKHA